MNDARLKKGIKRSLILFGIGIFVVLCLALYISISPNSKKTIYDEYNLSNEMSTGISKVYLESKGIKKEEFEKYLSVAAMLVRDNIKLESLNENEKSNYIYMQTVQKFMSDVLGTEVEVNETTNESTIYEQKVKEILKEFNGKYVKDNLNVENYFKFTEDELGNKYYVVKNSEDFVSYITELKEVDINGDLINVKFTNVFGTNEEITKYMNNEKVSLNTYEFDAVLKENLSFEYSKYYISDIKLVSKEMKEYNK